MNALFLASLEIIILQAAEAHLFHFIDMQIFTIYVGVGVCMRGATFPMAVPTINLNTSECINTDEPEINI